MNSSSSSSGLVRSLGLGFVVIVLIANVLGSGVYKKVAPMADLLGASGWVLMAWVAGGLITLLGALSNAEVAGLLADTGGEYAYFKKIYNRFISFMFGWASFSAIQTTTISALAYVFAQSLLSVAPLPETLITLKDVSIGGIFYPFDDFTTKIVAVILILCLTIFNTKSIKTSANLNRIILWLVIIGLSVIVIFGLTSGKANLAQSFDFSTPADKPLTISVFFTAMLAAFWAYQGWTSIGFLGGEIKEPHKNLPKGIAIGTLVIIAIYFAVNMTYMAILPIDALQGVHASGNQVAAIEVIKVIWGNGGTIFISILILVTTLGCTHVTIYGSARPYYAMAKEGLFFKSMAKLNASHVPANVLWFQCAWACVLVFSGSFDQLTDMAVFAVFIFYGATALGVFILRKKMPDAHRPYKVWGYPFVPAIFILFCIGLVVNTFITQPREAFIGVALILAGVPLYLWFSRKNA
ncbi:MAG: amino acid permease [Cyclobacteriaceae bacterium]|nr:amino acid permease [Cyclobacteriaceae bacterium]